MTRNSRFIARNFNAAMEQIGRAIISIAMGIDQPYHLIASLLYGSGLRLMEALRLRLKDIDFERLAIVVRSGKGGKDRVTIIPEHLVPDLRRTMERVHAFHQQDLADGYGEVQMPYALAKSTRRKPEVCTGSFCLRHHGSPLIRFLVSDADIISTKRVCNGQ